VSFPRYPKYKDSGVEWLGEVPSHWEIQKVRRLFEIRKRIAGRLGYDVLSITQQGIRVKALEGNDGQLSMDYSKYQIVEPGDFAMNHMDLITGYVDISPVRGVTSPDYRVFRVRSQDCYDKYLLYLFQMGYRNRIFFAYGQGSSQLGRWRLPSDQFNELPFPVPPRHEQEEIAPFLDRETAKIDGLVAEQQRLMELLTEKRQAVISHAVTKGLNPDARMKPSGIEWLGDIPAQWSGLQVGKVCIKVADGPHFSPNYVDEGIRFLSARNVRVDGWSLDDVKYISASDCDEFDRRVIPQIGDILYTKGGTTGVARVVDLTDRFQVWVHVAVLKIKAGMVDPHYLAFALNSVGCYEQSQLLTRGATNNDLGLTRLVKIWLALPPLDEQEAIIQYLQVQTSQLDTLTAEAHRAIDLLQERRTALISAAVTGQIDVLGLAESDVA
jgi:type I restriction enzyme, S subunit